MLSLSAISDAAISALPSESYNDGTASVRCAIRFEAVPRSSYQAFIMNGVPKLYAVEIGIRPLRSRIET